MLHRQLPGLAASQRQPVERLALGWKVGTSGRGLGRRRLVFKGCFAGGAESSDAAVPQ